MLCGEHHHHCIIAIPRWRSYGFLAAKPRKLSLSSPHSTSFKPLLCLSFASRSKCQNHVWTELSSSSLWLDGRDKVQASADLRNSWTKELLLVGRCLISQTAKSDLTITTPDTAKQKTVFLNLEIIKLVRKEKYIKALEFFKFMQQEGINTNKHTYMSLLKACAALAASNDSRHVHACIIRSKNLPNLFLENCLINLYGECGSIEDACKIFNSMLVRDVVSWSAMLTAFVKCGEGEKALRLFQQMHRENISPNIVTFLGMLSGCAKLTRVEDGRDLHAQIVCRGLHSNIAIQSSLVDMYSKCNSIEDAYCVFINMRDCNVVSWTTMITGYVRCGQPEKALILFHHMERERVEPNSRTLVGALNACAKISALEEGRHIHKQIVRKALESHIIVGSSLIDMYSKCGCMDDAQKVFDKMLRRNVVSWSSMIAGYGKGGELEKAVNLFEKMMLENVEPNRVTYLGILNACTTAKALEAGRRFHAKILLSPFHSDVTVGNNLIDMYTKNSCLTDAIRVFENLPERNVVSWTTMIVGLVKLGEEEKALQLFQRMQKEKMQSTTLTFTAVLIASARLVALNEGRCVHAHMIQNQMDSNVLVMSSLIYMYAKCGSLDDACRVFNVIEGCDQAAWNVMMLGYAIHGRGKDALQLFEQMQRVGLEGDDITFVCALSACSHAGLVVEGCCLLECMLPMYGVTVKLHHYSCMVDLFGRSSHLDAANEMIMRMPPQPGVPVWRTLLGACKVHGDLEIGEGAANHVFDLDPENASAYLLLSDIYARRHIY